MLFLSSFVENIGKKTLYQGYCHYKACKKIDKI